MDDKMKAYIAFGSVSFFWGTTYLAIRIGVEVLPPLLFAGLRFLLAGILFAFVLRLRGYHFPAVQEWRHLTIIGVALLVIGNGTVVWAEQYVPSSVMALVVATLPFFMAMLNSLLPQGEQLSLQKMIGILVGFAGLLLLLRSDLQGSMEGTYLVALLLALVAPLVWSMGSIYSKNRRLKTPPLMAAAAQMIIAGVILTLLGSVVGEWRQFHFSKQGLGAMVYLIFFGSIVGYGSYIYALDKLSTTMVSMYAYINPIVAVVLGWLVLSERLDAEVIVATTIILSGVILVKSNTKMKGAKKRSLLTPTISTARQPQLAACTENRGT